MKGDFGVPMGISVVQVNVDSQKSIGLNKNGTMKSKDNRYNMVTQFYIIKTSTSKGILTNLRHKGFL